VSGFVAVDLLAHPAQQQRACEFWLLRLGIPHVSLHKNKLQLNQDYESNPVNGLQK
jgi:hypothetical protein